MCNTAPKPAAPVRWHRHGRRTWSRASGGRPRYCGETSASSEKGAYSAAAVNSPDENAAGHASGRRRGASVAGGAAVALSGPALVSRSAAGVTGVVGVAGWLAAARQGAAWVLMACTQGVGRAGGGGVSRAF